MAAVYKRNELLGDEGWTLEEYARFQLNELRDDLFENVGIEYEDIEEQMKHIVMTMMQIVKEKEEKQNVKSDSEECR